MRRGTRALLVSVLLLFGGVAVPEAQMSPYFSAINYPVPQDTMMVMLLSDFQSARSTNNFLTGGVGRLAGQRHPGAARQSATEPTQVCATSKGLDALCRELNVEPNGRCGPRHASWRLADGERQPCH
jgi:hypothetical protein